MIPPAGLQPWQDKPLLILTRPYRASAGLNSAFKQDPCCHRFLKFHICYTLCSQLSLFPVNLLWMWPSLYFSALSWSVDFYVNPITASVFNQKQTSIISNLPLSFSLFSAIFPRYIVDDSRLPSRLMHVAHDTREFMYIQLNSKKAKSFFLPASCIR